MNYLWALVFTLTLFSPAAAKANWLCKVAASERNGDTIYLCGVAEGDSENEARISAGKAAYQELDLICSKSPDCYNFELVFKPLRTDCSETPEKKFKCYRGLEATITDVKRDKPKSYGNEIIVPVKKMVVQDDIEGQLLRRNVITFDSLPQDADVYVNGIELCKTPCSKEIQHGTHSVSMQLSDHETITKNVTVVAATNNITWTMKGKYGYLSFAAVPKDSTVKIDDMVADSMKSLRVLPGKHIVTIENPSYQPFNTEVKVTKGEISQVVFKAEPLYGLIEFSAKDPKGNALVADIYIDGKYKGVTPQQIKVQAGEREIELKTPKFSKSGMKNVKADSRIKMNLELTSLEAQGETGIIEFAAKDEDGKTVIAEIYVDGKYKGVTPQQVNVAVGERRIELRSGNLSRSGVKNVKADARIKMTLELQLMAKGSGCMSDRDCPQGKTCASVRGEYPGSCAATGLFGGFLESLTGNSGQ